MADFIDITKIGPQNYKDLQEQNNPSNMSVEEGMRQVFGPVSMFAPTSGVETPVQTSLGNWGESRFDESAATGDEINRLKDIRAENQPWIAKLGAGISKGAILAGTTFLYGTIGLAYGIGTAATEGRWSGLWDNDVSNALASINKASEDLLPNYRTAAEEEREWYRNLGTVNFWADSFLKNLGFTVGALYSGKVWAAPLQLAKLPAIAGEITGSLLSAVNEGRIEANNNVADWRNLQLEQLDDAYQTAVTSLNPDDEMYMANLALLQQNYEQQKRDIEDRAGAMGNGILLANTILLSYTNFKTFGKIYSGGFRRASQDFIDTERHAMSKRVSGELGEQTFRKYTTKEGLIAGGRTGLREGLEEMNQALISETGGIWNAPDSPDAYYNALLNPEADIQTTDFLTAATKGFVNTYGSGERWEEFVIGGLTGLLGVPTVGKMSNSSANTYLGRGKWLGLTGGLFGELSVNRERNQQGQSAVDIMNKYAKKVLDQKDYFVQSQSFIDAMDRWSEENNAFEYKNAEDNDDFVAIAAFARVGRIQDLKDLVNKDFENMSDEDLDRIAKYTSKDSDDPTLIERQGWRDVDGKYLSETEEGRQAMRESLSAHRDKLLKNIDEYVKSVEIVRGLLHDSPNASEDIINELAWLNWKLGRFEDRFEELKKEDESTISNYITALGVYKSALLEEYQSMMDAVADDASRMQSPEIDQNIKMRESITDMENFLIGLQKTTKPLGLAALIKNNDEFLGEYLGEKGFNLFGKLANETISHNELKKLYDDLQDLSKMAIAAEQFNQRYKEFVEDRSKLLKNREKQEKKSEANRNNIKAQKLAQNIANSLDETGDLPEGIDTIEASSILKAEGVEITDVVQKAANALDQINELEEFKSKVLRILNSLNASQQVKIDARTLLDNDKIESAKDAFAYDSALYRNYNNIYRTDDEALIGKSKDEQMFILQERMLNLEQAMRNVEAKLAEEDEILNNLDNTVADVSVPEFNDETGNDPTSTVPGINFDTLEGTETTDEDAVNYFKRLFTEDTPEIDKACKDLVSAISKSANLSPDKVLDSVHNTQAYKDLSSKVEGNTLDAAIVQYLMDKVKDSEDSNPASTNAPLVPSAAIDESTKKVVEGSNDVITGGKPKTYWSPIQSMLPIHIPARHLFEGSPFDLRYYKLVEAKVPGYLGYSYEQKQYIVAVGKYLDEHGAFRKLDSGTISQDEEIHFSSVRSLNKEAGTTVILLTDKDNNVLGVLPNSKFDSTFSTYTGLDKFEAYFNQKYSENSEENEDALWTLPNILSHINKWMIGKVLYGDVEMNVNEIFRTLDSEGNQIVPELTFAIAAADKNGRIRIVSDSTKRQNSTEEQQILRPLNPTNGQPFVLLDTRNPDAKSRKYVAIPVHMAAFNSSTNPVLTKLVEDKLSNILKLNSKSSTTQIGKAKSELQDLLGAKFAINFTNGNVILSAKRNGKWEVILEAPENITDSVELSRYVDGTLRNIETLQIPVHMSLKYINKKYNGADYNSLIAPFVNTNLEQGHPTGTVSNWFSINPIEISDKQEPKEVKVKGPKSIGKNTKKPETPTATTFTYTYNGRNIAIDTSDFNTVYYWDETGKIVTSKVRTDNGLNKNTAKAAAYGYGIVKHQDMTQPYETPWGTYNPTIQEFVVQPEKPKEEFPDVPGLPENFDLDSLLGSGETLTEEQLNSQAEEKGLLSTALYKNVWDELKLEEKTQVMSAIDPKQVIVGLSTNWDSDEETFKAGFSVTGYLTANRETFFRKVDTSEPYKKWNKGQEISWLGKVLPQFSTEERLSIVDGMIRTNQSGNPDYAWGQFKNGIMTISNGAAMGTVYHEAFHAVSTTLLSEGERTQMYEEARKLYKVADRMVLEEKLAEEFRMYVQMEEMPFGGLIRWFRKLKHLVLGLVGKDSYIDNLFFRISNGEYAAKPISNSAPVAYQRELTAYHLQKTSYKNLSQEDRDLLEAKGLSKELYDTLSLPEREQLLFCR